MKIFNTFFLSFLLSSAYSQIIITEVYFDTPYSEEMPRVNPVMHHLGEYIELYNFSNEDIPLDGWCLTDYVSRYDFPDGIIIPSNQFLIIAFRGNSTTDYFPTYFPSTIGKESQILYQNQIILRNDREKVQLRIGKLRGHDFGTNFIASEINWNNPLPPSNLSPHFQNPANVDYYLNSYQSWGNGLYDITATPLDGQTPPTENIASIAAVNELHNNEYSNLTWQYYADLILNMTCPTVPGSISQTPIDPNSIDGRCFDYDTSGNNISSSECEINDEENGQDEGTDDDDTTGNNGNQPDQYSSTELEEINSKIVLYPVPTHSTLNSSWANSIAGVISEIQIINTSGTPVGVQQITNQQLTADFNLVGLPSGIYIVKFLLNSGQIISRNIIKY